MTLPPEASALLSGVRIDGKTKGFPDLLEPLSLAQVKDLGWSAYDLAPPSLVLRCSALQHNVRLMAAFAADRGVSHAPHGKVGMSPAAVVDATRRRGVGNQCRMRVGRFLDDLRALSVAIASRHAFEEPPIVSAGGARSSTRRPSACRAPTRAS